jgi:hypothetical protein
MAKISIDSTRLAHLMLLLFFTYVCGQFLIQTWEWTNLTAYGLSCSIVCQISNAVLRLAKESGEERLETEEGQPTAKRECPNKKKQ